MSTYRFEAMLNPRSVAVVGAGDREGSVGRAVLSALREGGFAGPVHPVHPRHGAIDRLACHASLADLPEKPDLVIVATPPAAVPKIVAQAGACGAAAAIVLSANLGDGEDAPIGLARRVARRHGLRLVGPDSIGLAVPGHGLNASLLARAPKAGDVALVSHSGTVASAIAAWAARREVGFSAILALGRAADVDVCDCLDHFAADYRTRAILISLEQVDDARKFLSAARAAARAKPVVVLRPGRHARAQVRPATHTGALARPDAVYAAAFRRAGLLAVEDLDAMFSAVETLTRLRPFPGKRLTIVANGRGIATLAADKLTDLGGRQASLSPPPCGEEVGGGGGADTRSRSLSAPPPPSVPPRKGEGRGVVEAGTNPLDLGIDAVPEDYATALVPPLKDHDSDAVLALHVPTARAGAKPVAEAMAAALAEARAGTSRRKPLFAVSIGEDEAAAQVFSKAAIPLFPTEADAVTGFMHLVRYREAQDDLMRTPDALPRDFAPDVEAARGIVARALANGEGWLDPEAVAGLLAAYGIPFVPAALAPDADAAADAAWPCIARGEAVALKLVSPDIVHKSEVGGVRLGLTSEADVREAVARMLASVREKRPEARITGFAVQPMVPRGTKRELIAGLAEDPTFGPVVVFGQGGTAVELIDDRALGLPPLDLRLAHEQIGRTRIARRLGAYRDVPAADVPAIALTLVKLSQLAADLPEVRELDINPLLADEHGVRALDTRVRVERRFTRFHARHSGAAQRNPEPRNTEASHASGTVQPYSGPPEALGSGFSPLASPGMTEGSDPQVPSTARNRGQGGPSGRGSAYAHLAIRPYPAEWERTMTLKGRRIRVRPVRPEDEALFAAFFRHVTPEDVRLRFFAPVKDFSHAFLARLTQLDYSRAIAFVALDAQTDDPEQQMLGAVRLHADANHESGEFAILVRSDIKGYGLGYALMRMMIEWARAEGIGRIEGTVLAENHAMLRISRRLGFEFFGNAREIKVIKTA